MLQQNKIKNDKNIILKKFKINKIKQEIKMTMPKTEMMDYINETIDKKLENFELRYMVLLRQINKKINRIAELGLKKKDVEEIYEMAPFAKISKKNIHNQCRG
ncbi:MAG: hypothetical protein AAB526_01085 [Patescibacteria group bacterium]